MTGKARLRFDLINGLRFIDSVFSLKAYILSISFDAYVLE
jgi:hypothetical protein